MLASEAARRQAMYDSVLSAEGRLALQVKRFNEVWHRVRTTVPFYVGLSNRNSLPASFSDWGEINDGFPIIDKSAVRRHSHALTSTLRPPDFHRITGGSTATPVQLPAWNVEWVATARADRWLPRAWYGIRIEDRQFAIWGHSHTLGTGLKGLINKRKRQVKDYLLGYYRLSAYDMSEGALRAGGAALVNFRPAYVYGYSVALVRFALANQHLRDQFHLLRLRAVIAAAEGFPSPDSVPLLEDTFGAPVAMEYGSVETDLVAHTAPHGSFRTMWLSYFLEAAPTGEVVEGGMVCRLLITALYPRCFPLIRYDLGDEIILKNDSPVLGVTSFARVRGRCNDYLVLPDGTRIHSELITHCVRAIPQIEGYQAVQDQSGIRVEVVTDRPLSTETVASIRHKLGSVHRHLSNIPIVQVDQLQRSTAGKSLIVRRIVGEDSSCSVACKIAPSSNT